MKAQELREMTKEQLNKELNEKKAELCQLRFDISARQIKNYKKATLVKKDIARIMSVLEKPQTAAPVTNTQVDSDKK